MEEAKVRKQTSLRASWLAGLDAVAAIAMIAAASVLLWTNTVGRPRRAPAARAATVPTVPLSLDGTETFGNRAAKVVLIEFTDFECPFCRSFARDTLPALERLYIEPGKLLVAIRQLPLPSLHPLAVRAAEAAVCAGRQGRFKVVHDAFFARSRLDDDTIADATTVVGVDTVAHTACLAADGPERVRRDIDEAKTLGIRSTPTFLFGLLAADGKANITDVLSGSKSVGEFQALLDSLLQRAQ
jgi:protein-disulfide isomerase